MGATRMVILGLSLLTTARALSLSNSLGDNMVLQRAPASSVVWGFAAAGVQVRTSFRNHTWTSTADAQGVWRQKLPPQPASTGTAGEEIMFQASDGGTAALTGVLFGDVFICGGQSNMEYSPDFQFKDNGHDWVQMNNRTAEVASADLPAYRNIRFFKVGSSPAPTPQQQFGSITLNWTQASAKALSPQLALWDLGGGFSAVCWLFGKRIHNELGGQIPIGLISSNVGGTTIEKWIPPSALADCNSTYDPSKGVGELWNGMIAPMTLGPLRITGSIWYQGEANVGFAEYYSCAFPSLITAWRDQWQNQFWFGFVQIAGYHYGDVCGYGASATVADLRQAQLAGLSVHNTTASTAIDVGDWGNIHPDDKQTPAFRLAVGALDKIYGLSRFEAEASPVYKGPQAVTREGSIVHVTIPVSSPISTTIPPWATAPTTTGHGTDHGSVPRNQCITVVYEWDANPYCCGYPGIHIINSTGGMQVLNATAKLGQDSQSVVLSAQLPDEQSHVVASSYGRGAWPMTLFFSNQGAPLLPWYALVSSTSPWELPREE